MSNEKQPLFPVWLPCWCTFLNSHATSLGTCNNTMSNWKWWLCPCSHCAPTDKHVTACMGMYRGYREARQTWPSYARTHKDLHPREGKKIKNKYKYWTLTCPGIHWCPHLDRFLAAFHVTGACMFTVGSRLRLLVASQPNFPLRFVNEPAAFLDLCCVPEDCGQTSARQGDWNRSEWIPTKN